MIPAGPMEGSWLVTLANDGIDLTGRRAIVTGGASGIGIETARAASPPTP